MNLWDKYKNAAAVVLALVVYVVSKLTARWLVVAAYGKISLFGLEFDGLGFGADLLLLMVLEATTLVLPGVVAVHFARDKRMLQGIITGLLVGLIICVMDLLVPLLRNHVSWGALEFNYSRLAAYYVFHVLGPILGAGLYFGVCAFKRKARVKKQNL